MTELTVRPPADTPPGEALFVAGPGRNLGDWSATRHKLVRGADGLYRAALGLAPGDSLLVTRGDFRRAEANPAGFVRAPHAVPADFAGSELHLEVAAWAPDPIRYIESVHSEFGGRDRTVTVALPPGYDGDSRFPVMYLHDGQNLFDHETSFAGAWGCYDAACRATFAGLAASVILVGIANTQDRLEEYGPRADAAGADDAAHHYADFIVKELKPRIDGEYRTLAGPEHTGVGGSSMGGLASLHLGMWHPEVFGKVAALSPSLWWDRQAFARTFDPSSAWLKSCRIWLDMGGHEGPDEASQKAGLRHARRAAKLLHEAGADATFREYPDGEHVEWQWGSRFPDVLKCLFPA